MKSSRLRLFALAIFASTLAAFVGGCAHPGTAVQVRPWERAVLADYTMRLDRDPLASEMSEHVFFAREAAAGGRGVGGSGCGCN